MIAESQDQRWCAFCMLQKTVGTVVKTTDSVDPIALLTVLPLRRYTSLTCLKEIKAYFGAKCNSKTQQSFQQVCPVTGIIAAHTVSCDYMTCCVQGHNILLLSRIAHCTHMSGASCMLKCWIGNAEGLG